MRIAHLLLACLTALPAAADEGLWPYNQFPTDAVKQKFGFDAGAAFLDHLRLASVKMPGGSGAFVSATGLLPTSRDGHPCNCLETGGLSYPKRACCSPAARSPADASPPSARRNTTIFRTDS